jgi:Asp-tRNA(Asn)/Glu-tRNA(Gln) amidotransferase A subunit family amidase
MAWTLDNVGPICRMVEDDAALMLGVIAAFDEMDPTTIDPTTIDPTTIDMPVPEYSPVQDARLEATARPIPRRLL